MPPRRCFWACWLSGPFATSDIPGRRKPPPDVSARLRATRELTKSPVLWGLTAVRGFRAMALVALVTTLPLYLSNDLGMNEWNRGFHIGLLIAVGLVAKTGAGYLSDRWGRKEVLVPGPGLVLRHCPGPGGFRWRLSC